MRSKGHVFPVLVIAICLLFCACRPVSQSDNSSTVIPMSVLSGWPASGWDEKETGGLWIGDKEQMAALASRVNSVLQTEGRQFAFPEVDYTKDSILLIWMGLKPTGGYALELIGDTAQIESHTAVVPIRWIEPPADAMVIQMITNPVLAIRLAKGPYDRIEVIDQNGAGRVVVEAAEK